jgi:SAM-dependent methyltransferase
MQKIHFYTSKYLFKRACEVADIVFEKLPEGKLRVLDVPAGAGAYSQYLQEKHGAEVIAADIDPSKWVYTQCKFQQANLAREIPFESNSFDVVFCIEGLKHVSDVQMALAELSRVLKPGGTLVFSIPNDLCMQSRLRYLFDGFVDTDWVHPMQVDSENERQFLHLGSLLSLPYVEFFQSKANLKTIWTTHDKLRFWSVLFAIPLYPLILFFTWKACNKDFRLFKEMVSLTWLAGRRNIVVSMKRLKNSANLMLLFPVWENSNLLLLGL